MWSFTVPPFWHILGIFRQMEFGQKWDYGHITAEG